MATFFVYENGWGDENQWYTMIHFADCVHCDYGRGHNVRNLPNDFIDFLRTIQVKSAKVSNRWIGPFQTYQQALDAARRTGKEVRKCNVCAPY